MSDCTQLQVRHIDSYWIPFHADSLIGRLVRRVDLSYNTQLRALHVLSIRLDTHADTTWLPKIISRVTSPHMNDFLFYTEVHRFEDLSLMDWDALSSILRKSLFSSLRRVEFRIEGRLWSKSTESYIR